MGAEAERECGKAEGSGFLAPLSSRDALDQHPECSPGAPAPPCVVCTLVAPLPSTQLSPAAQPTSVRVDCVCLSVYGLLSCAALMPNLSLTLCVMCVCKGFIEWVCGLCLAGSVCLFLLSGHKSTLSDAM